MYGRSRCIRCLINFTASTWKTLERQEKISHLTKSLESSDATVDDKQVLALSLPQLVLEYDNGNITAFQVLQAYRQRSILAHEATNCLADVMFDDEALRHVSPRKPLSGIPITLKDCVNIAGHDSTAGYSSHVGRPILTSAPIVQLLQDAGAIIHAKTTVPIGLLSFETTSDLFGETTSPYNPKFSPGASTGGGAALLAYQGSMVEVGTDLGGEHAIPRSVLRAVRGQGLNGEIPGLRVLVVLSRHGSGACSGVADGTQVGRLAGILEARNRAATLGL